LPPTMASTSSTGTGRAAGASERTWRSAPVPPKRFRRRARRTRGGHNVFTMVRRARRGRYAGNPQRADCRCPTLPMRTPPMRPPRGRAPGRCA
jgi:hypothetical protein